MVPKLTLLSWKAFKKRAPDVDKNDVPDGGAFLHEWKEVVAWRFYALLPYLGERLLAHEWWHATKKVGNAKHAAWWTFRIECGHPLRFRDPAGLLKASAAWRAKALSGKP